MSRSFIIGIPLDGDLCGWNAFDRKSGDREWMSKGIIVTWSMSEFVEFLRLALWRLEIEWWTDNDVCLFNARWNIGDYWMKSMRKLMSRTWKTLSRLPVHGRCIIRSCDLAVLVHTNGGRESAACMKMISSTCHTCSTHAHATLWMRTLRMKTMRRTADVRIRMSLS